MGNSKVNIELIRFSLRLLLKIMAVQGIRIRLLIVCSVVYG